VTQMLQKETNQFFRSIFSKTSLKLLSFILILVLVDTGLGIYAQQKIAQLVEIKKYRALKDNPQSSECVIFGSSHAKMAFHPQVIQEQTGLSSYNYGFGSGNITNVYTLFQEYIHVHQAPKYLIIVPDLYFISDEGVDGLGVYPFLFPCMKLGEKIETFVGGHYSRIKLLKLLCGTFLFRGNRHIKEHSGEYYKGYASNSKEVEVAFTEEKLFEELQSKFKIQESVINKKNKGYLVKLIEEAKELGIQVLLVQAPEPSETIRRETNRDFFNQAYQEIADEYQVPYLNYNQINDFTENLRNFTDSQHLSSVGAKIFSKQFAKDLDIRSTEN